MILKKPYKDLDETLMYMKMQIIDSLPYAKRVCPQFDSAKELFDWLKPKLKYQNDPKGIELLQTMQTLFKRGGRGDCDCFVITTCACLIVNEVPDIYAVLVGRSKSYPVHIYTSIKDGKKREVLDFTNKRFNMERENYKYIQEVPLNWHKWRGIAKILK